MDNLAGLRLYRINHDAIVVAPKTMSKAEVAAFYEDEEMAEVFDMCLVGFFDRPDADSRETYADRVRRCQEVPPAVL